MAPIQTQRQKPIFHQKQRLRWVANANEIYTNMKCTWPMRAPMQGDQTRPLFHQLKLGLVLGRALGDCDSHWVHSNSRWVHNDSRP